MAGWQRSLTGYGGHRILLASSGVSACREDGGHASAATPGDPGAYRLLSLADLHAHDHDQAAQVIRAGLEIAPYDPALVEQQGDLCAADGRPQDALTCWRRAFTLAPVDYGISMRYGAAFLLERQDRLAEAAQEWRFIIGWSEERGYTITADWPRRELQRLEARQAGS